MKCCKSRARKLNHSLILHCRIGELLNILLVYAGTILETVAVKPIVPKLFAAVPSSRKP
jgi:hypothetical protein